MKFPKFIILIVSLILCSLQPIKAEHSSSPTSAGIEFYNSTVAKRISSFINESERTNLYVKDFSGENEMLISGDDWLDEKSANNGNQLVYPGGCGTDDPDYPDYDKDFYNRACLKIDQFNTGFSNPGYKVFIVTGSLFIHTDLQEDYFRETDVETLNITNPDQNIQKGVEPINATLNSILESIYDEITIEKALVFYAMETRMVHSWKTDGVTPSALENDHNITNFGYFKKGDFDEYENIDLNAVKASNFAKEYIYHTALEDAVTSGSLRLNVWLFKLTQRLYSLDNPDFTGHISWGQYSYAPTPIDFIGDGSTGCTNEARSTIEIHTGHDKWNDLVEKFAAHVDDAITSFTPTLENGSILEKYVRRDENFEEPFSDNSQASNFADVNKFYQALEEKSLVLRAETDIQFYTIIKELVLEEGGEEVKYHMDLPTRHAFINQVAIAAEEFNSLDKAVLVLVPFSRDLSHNCTLLDLQTDKWVYDAYPSFTTRGDVGITIGQTAMDNAPMSVTLPGIEANTNRVYEYVHKVFRETPKPHRIYKYVVTPDAKVYNYTENNSDVLVKGYFFINELVTIKHKKHEDYNESCFWVAAKSGFTIASASAVTNIGQGVVTSFHAYGECGLDKEADLTSYEEGYSTQSNWVVDKEYAYRIRERYVKKFHKQIIYEHYLSKCQVWVEAMNGLSSLEIGRFFVQLPSSVTPEDGNLPAAEVKAEWEEEGLPNDLFYSYQAVHDLFYNVVDVASAIPVIGAGAEGVGLIYATAAGHSWKEAEYAAGTALNLATGGFGGTAKAAVRAGAGVMKAKFASNSADKFRVYLKSGDDAIELAKAGRLDIAPCDIIGINNNSYNPYFNLALSSTSSLTWLSCPFDVANLVEGSDLKNQIESVHDLLDLPGDDLTVAADIAKKLANADRAGADAALKAAKGEEFFNSKGARLLNDADDAFFSLIRKFGNDFNIPLNDAAIIAGKLGTTKINQLTSNSAVMAKILDDDFGVSKRISFLEDCAKKSSDFPNNSVITNEDLLFGKIEDLTDAHIDAWKKMSDIPGNKAWVRQNPHILDKMVENPTKQDNLLNYYSDFSPNGPYPCVRRGEAFNKYGFIEFKLEDYAPLPSRQYPPAGANSNDFIPLNGGVAQYNADGSLLSGPKADYENAAAWFKSEYENLPDINITYPGSATEPYLGALIINGKWYTMHHMEDGKTIVPIFRDVHNVSHTGGAKIIRNNLQDVFDINIPN